MAARLRVGLGALFASLLGIIAYGMWTSFPLFDDNYFVLYQRESTLDDLFAQHVNRPVYGALLKWMAMAFGIRPGPEVVLAIGLWALLAWQTSRLSRRLLPGETATAWLAALLTLTPAIVTTQYTTITTVLPGNLPVSLALCGLLLCLRENSEGERGRTFGAAALVAVGVVISEYALSAGFASAALLAVRRRFRKAGGILLGVVAGYAVFWATADLDFRPKQSPAVQAVKLLHEPHKAILRFAEGLWQGLIGGWAGTARAVRLEAGSLSTILALFLALAAAVLFAMLYRSRSTEAPVETRDRVGWSLVAAVGAGILPIVVANRNVFEPDAYETRYLLPALPFAALALAAGVRGLIVNRFRPATAAVMAAMATYLIVVGAFQARMSHKQMERLGDLLRPSLRDPGITIGVVPRTWGLEGHDLTPKVTMKWTDDEARRLWLMSEDSAAARFGPRSLCHGTDSIDMPPEFLTTARKGPISHLLWVSARTEKVQALEPYCLVPTVVSAAAAPESPPGR